MDQDLTDQAGGSTGRTSDLRRAQRTGPKNGTRLLPGIEDAGEVRAGIRARYSVRPYSADIWRPRADLGAQIPRVLLKFALYGGLLRKTPSAIAANRLNIAADQAGGFLKDSAM
jgi:hypothetical protein